MRVWNQDRRYNFDNTFLLSEERRALNKKEVATENNLTHAVQTAQE